MKYSNAIVILLIILTLFGCAQAPYKSSWNSVTKLQSNISTLQIGDVIVKEEGSGFEEWFGHSALYLGNGYVLEAPNPQVGVIYNSLSNWSNNLGCMVLRYNNINPLIQSKLLQFAQTAVGKPYIISFNKFNTSGYSCSSLIYEAYEFATNHSIDLPKPNVWIVMPYDYLYSKDFSVVNL